MEVGYGAYPVHPATCNIHFKYYLVCIPKIMIHFVLLLDFCDLFLYEKKRLTLFNISIFSKPCLHFTHISVLNILVKSRNKVLGLTEANLRFGGTSQEWNLSNLFISDEGEFSF